MDIPRLKKTEIGFCSQMSASEYEEAVRSVERKNNLIDFANNILDIIDKPDDKKEELKIFKYLKSEKMEISDIPESFMLNATFVEKLIRVYTEKIDDIVKNCPEEILKNEKIENLINIIQEENVENLNFEKETNMDIEENLNNTSQKTNDFDL